MSIFDRPANYGKENAINSNVQTKTIVKNGGMKQMNLTDKEMLEVVICKSCNQPEYYGAMHWRSGKTICRRCIYEIWDKESNWTPRAIDAVFPIYLDGEDYTKEADNA